MQLNSTYTWTAIILCGIVTFLIRFMLIQYMGKNISSKMNEWLSFVPPAVLSALTFHGIFTEGVHSIYFTNPKIWASLCALFIALKFKNVIATIIAGMSFLWILNIF